MMDNYGYVFFYNGKQVEIHADSLYAAKLKAVAHFKPRKSQEHMVHGMLAEKNGIAVIHNSGELG